MHIVIATFALRRRHFTKVRKCLLLIYDMSFHETRFHVTKCSRTAVKLYVLVGFTINSIMNCSAFSVRGSIPCRGGGIFRYITHNTARQEEHITRPSPITGNDWPLTSDRNIADERYNAVQTTSTIDAKAVRYANRHFMRFRTMRVNTPTCAIYDTYTSIMWWPQFQHRM